MAFLSFTTVREAFFLLSHPKLWLRKPLSRSSLNPNPINQFTAWYDGAKNCIGLEFPNAFCLSTVNDEGLPDGRIVLMKDYDESGFVFYTNTQSSKGKALASTPCAAMTFYWPPLQRQVRITGSVTSVDDDVADQYFAKRPRGSQISAWASMQSQPMRHDSELEERVKQYEQEFEGRTVPRPPHWTGYRIKPNRFEFWELRLSREHDRWVYEQQGEPSDWRISRLFP
jgi:pyridoxamine 5'-phosphate oxidase